MRWFVWAEDTSRDDAVVYSEMFAGSDGAEAAAKRFAEEFAEVSFYDDGGGGCNSYTILVAAVDDAGVEVGFFEYFVEVELIPSFKATRTATRTTL